MTGKSRNSTAMFNTDIYWCSFTKVHLHDINIPWNMKSHLITMFSTYYPNGKNKMLPVGETHLYGSLMNHTMRGPKTFLKLVQKHDQLCL